MHVPPFSTGIGIKGNSIINIYRIKKEKKMMKNVPKYEQIVRIILGVVLGLLALFMDAWHGWIRIGSGILAVSFIITALVGY